MKCRWLVAVAMFFIGVSAQARDAGVELAQRSVCLACHQVDTKRVGPSFRDIALRYSDNEEAAAYLARSIREGSRGLWGAIPMPAQRHVDPATALLLGEWIMSLAPAEQTGAEPSQGQAPSIGSTAESGGTDNSAADVQPH